MKIALVIPVYRRPELTKIVLEHYAELANRYNLVLVAVGSEGEVSRKLCESSGFIYIEHRNRPLSLKVTALFKEARKHNVDGVVWVGSDDLMSEGLVKYYFDNFNAEMEQVACLNSLYFYSIFHDKTIYLTYKSKELMGTARFMSRRVLDKLNWMPCGTHAYKRGIDSHIYRHYTKLKIKEKMFTMEEAGGICVDIKTDEVMTGWEMIHDHHVKPVDTSILHNYFPNAMPAIEALRPSQTGVEKLLFQK